MKQEAPIQFQNVGAGKTAFYEFPVGVNGQGINSVTLQYNRADNGAYGAVVSDIRLKVDDELIREHSATELNEAINAPNGSEFAVRTVSNEHWLTLYFERPWLQFKRDQVGTALNTNWMKRCRLEVDLANASTPALAGNYQFEDRAGEKPGLIHKIKRHQIPTGGSSPEFTGFEKSGLIEQISLPVPDAPAATTIDRILLKWLGGEMDITKKFADAKLAQLYQMVPATAWFHIAFDGDGRTESILPGNLFKKLQLFLNQAGTGTVQAITQYLQSPGKQE